MVLARVEVDRVAGADLLDAAATALREADALGHVYHLPVGVLMPARARAGSEVHLVGARAGGRVGGSDLVDVRPAREPV